MKHQTEIYPRLKTLAERLEYAFSNQSLSQTKVAKLIGVAQPSISGLLNGKTKTSKHCEALANVLGVDAQWLITGVSPHDESQFSSIINIALLKGFKDFVNTKSRVQIKAPENYMQLDIRSLRSHDIDLYSTNYIPMTDKGMGPLINEDSPVFFNTKKKLINDGDCYVISHGGIIQVRQLYNLPMGSIKVQALNPHYESFTLDVNMQQDQLFIVIGSVFAVVNYY